MRRERFSMTSRAVGRSGARASASPRRLRVAAVSAPRTVPYDLASGQPLGSTSLLSISGSSRRAVVRVFSTDDYRSTVLLIQQAIHSVDWGMVMVNTHVERVAASDKNNRPCGSEHATAKSNVSGESGAMLRVA